MRLYDLLRGFERVFELVSFEFRWGGDLQYFSERLYCIYRLDFGFHC